MGTVNGYISVTEGEIKDKVSHLDSFYIFSHFI